MKKSKMQKEELLFLLDKLAQGISQMFGNSCEVVISDIDHPDHSITSIYNSHVTGRKVGDPLSDMGYKFSQNKDVQDYINYPAKTQDGRILKCTTIQIKTDNAFIGFGINLDVTNYSMAQKALEQMLAVKPELEDAFSNNPNGILMDQISKVVESVGKPPALMNKQDRIYIVRQLRDAGLLKMQKSIVVIAEVLNISRYSVYNYLREIESEPSE